MTKPPTVYLDHAAATPLDPDVLSVMQPYLSEWFYNPSALYLAAKQVGRDITGAREAVAQTLGARPSEITFTAGGTEANNLAIHGIMTQFPDANIVVSAVEHDSVLKPAAVHNMRVAEVTSKGIVDLRALRASIDDSTVLVSIMYANNELGTVQPLSSIARIVQDIRHERVTTGNLRPLYLHTDACQAANYLPLTKARLGVDLMTLNGGKIYGSKQTGCLFVRSGVELHAQILGGGQERDIRSGTENVAGIIGFARALTKAQQLREAEHKRLTGLKEHCIRELYARVPNGIITTSLQEEASAEEVAEIMKKHPDALAHSLPPTLPNFVHIRIPGADNERLIMELDERGIMAAAGSACSASSDEPSHVLTAIGLSDADAQSSIRFTMGRSTTRADLTRVVDALAGLDAAVYTG